MIRRPYKHGISGTPNYEQHCVEGPGTGFGYHSHKLWPERQFTTKEESKIITNMCNDAYEEGIREMQWKLQKLIGIN